MRPLLFSLPAAIIGALVSPASGAGRHSPTVARSQHNSAAQFAIQIDTSGAEAILAAATADPVNAAASADTALRNSPVREMIAKMAKYDPKVTAEAFKAAVISNANGGSDAPFALAGLRKDPTPARRMLQRLAADRDSLEQRLSSRLAAFSPNGIKVRGRMLVVDGTPNQNGWVPDSGVADFYINQGFHRDDIDSLITTAEHEMFHVVQGIAVPGLDSKFDDQPKLEPDARGVHRARVVLLNLVIEGMATYVGDPTLVQNPGARLAWQKKELVSNLARSEQIFALFDTLLYRARRDPDTPLDPLLSIGFSGGWNQTGYYVGYRMAKAIDRYLGRDRLRALVAAPAEDFAADYIELMRAHPQDAELTPLSPSSIAIMTELKATR